MSVVGEAGGHEREGDLILDAVERLLMAGAGITYPNIPPTWNEWRDFKTVAL